MRSQITPSSDAGGLRIAVVVSRYHGRVTAALRDAAVARFLDSGGHEDDLIIVPAPGTFELTAICDAVASRHHVDAIVALGCVISGETAHDRYICESVAFGLTEVTVRRGVPVAFGVLTCATIEQAEARAGGEKGNKGEEAMTAAIETATTIARLARPAAGKRA